MTAKSVKEIKNSDFVGLHTMIRKSTKERLIEIAKKNISFTGAWDIDTALRELIWAYETFFNLNTRLDEIEVQFQELKAFVMENNVPKVQQEEKKDDNPDGLLGKHHIEKKEEKEDGKKD